MGGIDSYTKLLLHSNKVDGSISYPVTFYGTAQLDTAQSVFGGASLLLDGNSDYVTLPDSADWTLGTGDFTIEARVKKNATTGQVQLFLAQYQSDTNYWYCGVADNNKLRFRAVIGGAVVGDFDQTTATMSTGTWYHVAIVRSGSTCYMFIDGVSVPVTTNNAFGNISDISGVLVVGRLDASNGVYYNGWIDELRVSKTARWTSDFNVPTKEYVSDQYTALLLHFNGTDGATATADASGGDESGNNRIVTYAGTAQTDTAQNKFGGSSLLLDGNSDYVTVPDSDDWTYGNGAFTIDMWVRLADNSVNSIFVSQVNGTVNTRFFFLASGLNQLRFNSTNAAGDTDLITISCDFAPSNNVWYHVAVARNADTWYLFVNGVSKTVTLNGGSYSATLPNIAAALNIGRQDTGTPYYVNGWIDEVRISKGICRWVADFSVPTAEYDDINTFIKKIGGVDYASVKKVGGVAIASVKKIGGLA